MRYSEFNIIKFRNIENVRVSIKKGLTPIIGINDSGKSSILDAIETFHEFLYFDTDVENSEFEDFEIEAIIVELTQSELSLMFETLEGAHTTRAGALIGPKFISSPKHNTSMYYKIIKHCKDGKITCSELRLFDGKNCLESRRINEKDFRNREINGNYFPSIHRFNDFLGEPTPFIYPNNRFEYPNKRSHKEYEINQMYWTIGVEKSVLYTVFTEIKFQLKNREEALEEIEKLITEAFSSFSKKLSQPDEKILFKAYFHENEEGPYVEIKGIEKGREFNLSDRSSGFYCTYNLMMFTRFNPYINGLHKRGLILLDEPETHLHESVQSELLDYLIKISGSSDVVMATHSSHLLSPNKINLKNIQIAKKENGFITLKSYDGISGSKTNALMPVYTALQLDEFSELAYGKHIIVVEGKTDRYALRLFCGLDDRFSLWDCWSASNIGGKPTTKGLDKNVNILSQRDFDFMVLTDYDPEGIKAITDTKESLEEEGYSERWITKRIKNYNDFCKISPERLNQKEIKKHKKVTLETVFEMDMEKVIDTTFDFYDLKKKEKRVYSKKEFDLALETLFYEDKDRALTQEIIKKFSKGTRKRLGSIKRGIYEAFGIRFLKVKIKAKH